MQTWRYTVVKYSRYEFEKLEKSPFYGSELSFTMDSFFDGNSTQIELFSIAQDNSAIQFQLIVLALR